MNINIETVIAQLKKRYQFQSSVNAFLIMKLIDYSEQLQQHSVMQAEGSDVSEGAAVDSEGSGEADMSGVELQPDEVCGCHYMTPVWAGSNQCMKCNKNRL